MAKDKPESQVSLQRLRELVSHLNHVIDDPEHSAWGTTTTGADSSLVQRGLINDVLRATPLTIDGNSQTQIEEAATAVDTLTSLQPRDPAEGMLAAQMIATHKAGMEMLGLAMLNRTKAHTVDVLLRNATRLMALHAKQQDMLERRRARPAALPADAGGQDTTVPPARTAPALGEQAEAAPAGEVVRPKFGT
jgi:hypothetical protein